MSSKLIQLGMSSAGLFLRDSDGKGTMPTTLNLELTHSASTCVYWPLSDFLLGV